MVLKQKYLRDNGFKTMWLHTTLRMRPERYCLHTATYILAVLHDEMVALFLNGQSPSQSFNFLSFSVTCSSIVVIRIMGSFSSRSLLVVCVTFVVTYCSCNGGVSSA